MIGWLTELTRISPTADRSQVLQSLKRNSYILISIWQVQCSLKQNIAITEQLRTVPDNSVGHAGGDDIDGHSVRGRGEADGSDVVTCRHTAHQSYIDGV